MNLINSENVFGDIRNQGYSIVENFLTTDELSKARGEYFACMDQCRPHPQGEPFRPIELNGSPWRKFAVGSKTGSGEPYSQVLQTTYIAQRDKTYPQLTKIFNHMIRIRNEMTGMSLDFGADLSSDDFWNACRLHHYPRGGGHMASHRDTLFPRLLSEFEFPFMQMMVTLSNRGEDFFNGGGYVYNKAGEKIFFETEKNAGSLIFFNGETVHGVEDVDPDELLDMNEKKGRIAIFVNLYANLHKEVGTA